VYERFVVKRFVEVEFVITPFVAKSEFNVAPFALRFVVEAFVINALVNVSPVPEIPVVDANPKVVWPKTLNVPVKIPFPPVNPVALKLVVLAFANVAFVEKRLLIVAPFAERFVVEAFVENRLVRVAPVALKLVVEALVAQKFVEKRFVEVALVITELVANIFCENRFKNLSAFVPSERVMSVVGRMSASRFRVL
jgi:hypothetical protein